MLTLVGQPLGTLQYMSPEQATGRVQNVDQQADVYAMGVVLYKLLTGRHPHNLGRLDMVDALRHIAEVTPERLSARNRSLRGELEIIVEKAICKDRHGCYATVADFAADQGRYLAHEPILARPPSVAYLARKFVRRHRVLVASLTFVILSLATGIVLATREAARANFEAGLRANMEARRAGIQLAEAKVAQGDALPLLAERFLEARNAFNAAWDQFERQGESPLPAQLGIWELDQVSAKPIRVLMQDGRGISRVAISPNEQLLAIGWDNGNIEVRDVASNAMKLQFKLKSNVCAMSFSPDGRYVGATCIGQHQILNIPDRQMTQSMEHPGRMSSAGVREKNAAVSTKAGVYINDQSAA